MTTLPWSERVTMLSVNPDAATRDDVARLASELAARLAPQDSALPLDDAALDRIESGEVGVGPAVGERLIAQARAALTLRDELAKTNRLFYEAEMAAGEQDKRKSDELAECRALVQLHMDDSSVNAREADNLRAKLAQAEQERDEARKELGVVDSLLAESGAQCEKHIAASQASERKLREALDDVLGNATCACYEDGEPGHCPRCAVAYAEVRAALACPADSAALREMLTKADSEGFLAGMKAQQYACGTYGITEADIVPDHVRVDRLLGGGK